MENNQKLEIINNLKDFGMINKMLSNYKKFQINLNQKQKKELLINLAIWKTYQNRQGQKDCKMEKVLKDQKAILQNIIRMILLLYHLHDN